MSALAVRASPPRIPLDRKRIPGPLIALPRWVIWQAGPPAPAGKFSKIPIHGHTGRKVNANDPANWLSFDQACQAYDAGRCSGIGFVLCAEPVTQDAQGPLYLVAVDLDRCGHDLTVGKQIRKDLGNAYGEISPSLNGIRLLALSRTPIKGGNAGLGRELYSAGRFMTVTGLGGRGELVDATPQLQSLAAQWFAPANKIHTPAGSSKTLPLAGPPKTPENMQRVKDQLAHIPADCSYERWRNIVWAVLSSGWDIAEQLARDWSQTAPSRYDDQVFAQVVHSFDPARGITLGTLHHSARLRGWQPIAVAPLPTPATTHVAPVTHSRLLTVMALKARPRMAWRIRGLLPQRGLACIFGPSGVAKTFLALDMACAVGAAHPTWFGSKIKAAPVIYVALEGEAGIRQRIRAWETHHRANAPDALRLVLGNLTLLDASDGVSLAADIVQTLGTGAVVVIDTLNQSAPGADENSSADMGRVISNAKALVAAVDGIVILVHHAGKDQSRGMRGHSSLFAAMDTVIEVVQTQHGRAWRVAKSKDGISGVAHAFELVPYVVEQDEDGSDMSSCAIRPCILGKGTIVSKITGKNQKAAFQTLSALAAAYPSGMPVKAALAAVGDVLQCESHRRQARASEAIAGLTESGHLRQDDGGVYMT